jgi:hypothetical protein
VGKTTSALWREVFGRAIGQITVKSIGSRLVVSFGKAKVDENWYAISGE